MPSSSKAQLYLLHLCKETPFPSDSWRGSGWMKRSLSGVVWGRVGNKWKNEGALNDFNLLRQMKVKLFAEWDQRTSRKLASRALLEIRSGTSKDPRADFDYYSIKTQFQVLSGNAKGERTYPMKSHSLNSKCCLQDSLQRWWFSTRDDFAHSPIHPKGHLAVSGNILGCHSWS